MAIRTRYVLIAALVLVTALALLVYAQTTATKPEQSVPRSAPVTFAKGVRAVHPRAPTPQFTAIATGLFARPIVDTQTVKGDVAIRVWSLSVGPKTNTAATTLPGAAMLSLTSGSVEFIAADLRGRLQPGDTAAVPEGASVRFINADEQRPAILRAVIVSGR
jgi:hypothetical protein